MSKLNIEKNSIQLMFTPEKNQKWIVIQNDR